MDAQQNKQRVQESYRMFQNGDIQGLIERSRDDVVWHSPESDFVPFSGTFQGKQGMAEFFAKLGATMQPLRFEPRDFIAEGDKVVVTGDATWVIRANGRSFDSPWVHVFTMRDGMVAHVDMLGDTAAYERAFLPEPVAHAGMPTQAHH